MKKWFDNLKISKKLFVSFGIICLITLIVGVVGAVNIFRINDADTILYQEYTKGLQDAGNAAVDFQQLRYNVYKLRKSEGGTQSDIKSAITEVETAKTDFENHMTECDSSLSSGEFSSQHKNIKNEWSQYMVLLNENINAAKANDFATLTKNSKTLGDLGTTIRNDFTTLFDNLSQRASKESASNEKLAYAAMFIIGIAVLFGIILSILLSIFVSGTISKPMQKFATFAGLLAAGDIDVGKVTEEKDRLWVQRKDEIGTLASSFDKMIVSTTEQVHNMQAIAAGDLTTTVTVRSESDMLGKALAELVNKFHTLAVSIVSSADQVNSGAKQLAGSSTALSQGASEQASSVEELTASLEEITSQTAQNAQNAHTTDELAKSIKKDAETGNGQMAEMLHAMDEINISSDNIGKIIKVIEDIAFQTNILALNAAVEAARAGQYGKGFAVVAEEVRNLAGQSAKAAKETTDLIENSIKKVEAGTKIANNTAGALLKIVQGISRASDLVDNIASASNEQSAALVQINQGIIQVSQVVQTNAAAAEESAAASEELSSQAESLKKNVSAFKLSTGSMLLSTENTDHQIAERIKEPDRQSEKKHKTNVALKTNISLTENNFGKY